MPDREKVIKGLEWALENMVDPINDFRFAGYDGPIVLLNEPIVRDALALLKAQEPRVMTLEEVLAAEVVYAEDVDKAEIIPVLVDRRAHDRVVLVMARLRGGPSLTIYPLISEYGKRWRCWTSRPTNEQREAVKWE